jgi:hypothetical protein
MKSFLHIAYIFLGFHFLMHQVAKLVTYLTGSSLMDSVLAWVLMIGFSSVVLISFFIVMEYVAKLHYHK